MTNKSYNYEWEDEDIQAIWGTNKDICGNFKLGDIVEFEIKYDYWLSPSFTPDYEVKIGIISEINEKKEPKTISILCIWDKSKKYILNVNDMTLALGNGKDTLRFIKKVV